MTAARNRQILLVSRPRGEPTPDNFKLVETDVPEPGPGQMLLRAIYLSLDPYMRGRMDGGPSYAKPVEVGEVMEGRAVCEVVKANFPQYKSGDIVVATTGWQESALSDGNGVQKIDPSVRPLSYALGVFGMPGLTAYTGLLNIGKPQPGETLVVAAASGAVGSVVGQIAKIKGCRMVGIVKVSCDPRPAFETPGTPGSGQPPRTAERQPLLPGRPMNWVLKIGKRRWVRVVPPSYMAPEQVLPGRQPVGAQPLVHG
jgi:NADPH-dependent curcumin reductase CurA